MIYDELDDPADYSPALIVTGPEDGNVIDWPYQILEMPVVPKIKPLAGRHRDTPMDPVTIERLIYKRVQINVADFFLCPVAVFVPAEWPDHQVCNNVIVHLIRKAFKGAKGIRRPGS